MWNKEGAMRECPAKKEPAEDSCLKLIEEEVTSYIHQTNEVRLVAWDARLKEIVRRLYNVFLTPKTRYEYRELCKVVAEHLCADVCSLFLHDYEAGQEIMVMNATSGPWENARDKVSKEEELWFSVDLSPQSDLDNNRILEILRSEFGKKGISLPGNAAISVEKEDRDWFIYDRSNKQKYHVRVNMKELSVYKTKKIAYTKEDRSTTAYIWHKNDPVIRNSLRAIGETRKSAGDINSGKGPDAEPSTGIGQYDIYVWTGEDVYHCFRNFVGIPIRVRPDRAIGMIKLENKNWGDQTEPPKSCIYDKLDKQNFKDYRGLFQKETGKHREYKDKTVRKLFEDLLGEESCKVKSRVQYMIAARLVIEDRELHIIDKAADLPEPPDEQQLRLISDEYMEKGESFIIALDLQSHLEKHVFSELLKQAFEEVDVRFCEPKPTISTMKEGKEWKITDRYNEYTVKKGEKHLEVQVDRKLYRTICLKCKEAEERLDSIWDKEKCSDPDEGKKVSFVLFNISDSKEREMVGDSAKKEEIKDRLRDRNTFLYALNYPDFTEADMVVLSGVAAYVSRLIELHITQEAADYGIPLNSQFFTELDIA